MASQIHRGEVVIISIRIDNGHVKHRSKDRWATSVLKRVSVKETTLVVKVCRWLGVDLDDEPATAPGFHVIGGNSRWTHHRKVPDPAQPKFNISCHNTMGRATVH